LAGAALALVWAFTGWSLARQQQVLASGGEARALSSPLN
jgi:hypothetical protein